VLRIRLVTTGARTGQRREVPLYAFADGANLIIIGSNSGKLRLPGWVYNLRAHPTAQVVRGKSVTDVKAREVRKPAERLRLWNAACAEFVYYPRYEEKMGRLLPVFLLMPTGTER
jgi:F420H(2)-dependent quinone reductase